jgi:ATP-dependent DNA ligase
VGVEGIVIKQLSETYKPGKRSWQKLRIRQSTEAVVGAVSGPADALRLVLALPGRDGKLIVAGVTTALSLGQSREILEQLHPAGAEHPWPPELPAARIGAWGTRERVALTLVDPALVVEVEADTAFEFGKWRHPTRFVRARPDLDPAAVSAPRH